MYVSIFYKHVHFYCHFLLFLKIGIISNLRNIFLLLVDCMQYQKKIQRIF